MNQIKFKIPKYDKYTNYFLSALLFVIDSFGGTKCFCFK